MNVHDVVVTLRSCPLTAPGSERFFLGNREQRRPSILRLRRSVARWQQERLSTPFSQGRIASGQGVELVDVSLAERQKSPPQLALRGLLNIMSTVVKPNRGGRRATATSGFFKQNDRNPSGGFFACPRLCPSIPGTGNPGSNSDHINSKTSILATAPSHKTNRRLGACLVIKHFSPFRARTPGAVPRTVYHAGFAKKG